MLAYDRPAGDDDDKSLSLQYALTSSMPIPADLSRKSQRSIARTTR